MCICVYVCAHVCLRTCEHVVLRNLVYCTILHCSVLNAGLWSLFWNLLLKGNQL